MQSFISITYEYTTSISITQRAGLRQLDKLTWLVKSTGKQ